MNAALEHDDPDLALLAAHVDPTHYRARYPDIDRKKLDPVEHFHEHGWREGRSPNTWFDVEYYLTAYPDIRDANIDPLLHFIAHGRSEGRRPSRPGGPLRSVIDAAVPPAARVLGYDAPGGAYHIDIETLIARTQAACVGRRGLVLALSHDRYIDITGGMQIFIADEQSLFNGDRTAYLHLSPAIARPTLAPDAARPVMVQVIIDGEFVGLALPGDIATALAALPPALAPRRLLVVHSLLGHHIEDAAILAEALRTQENFFWVHDYASLCESHNLLRNDATFCHAPPPDSASCRICVYGSGRATHRAALRTLFERIPFNVVAPSQTALDLWQLAGGLPHRSARVHPNCVVKKTSPVPLEHREFHGGPVRVAFAGFPIASKGWPAFHDLVLALRVTDDYEFFHLAALKALAPMRGLTGIITEVDRFARFAMIDTLRNNRIDLIVAASPWPETFSYVAHEAFAAGVDVVTLADSGNIAAAVRRTGCGIVLDDAAALMTFFRDLHAVNFVRQRAVMARPGMSLRALGTTATLTLGLPAKLTTGDPDLLLIAGADTITAERDGHVWRFTLPEGIETVRLMSRSMVPGAITSGERDMRRLGIAVSHLTLDGIDVPADDPRRTSGWHGPDGTMQWTNGNAFLEVKGARRLELTLVPSQNSIACPLMNP